MTNSTPGSPATPQDPASPQSDGHAPYTNNTNVKDGDLKILTWVGIAAMSVLIVFGASLYWSGLLTFPAVPQDAANRDYYNDTLVYRERRMALALLMRTFLTGFSFVVGLALCTMGGLFILRQVTSLTSLSGNLGGGGIGAQMVSATDTTPKEAADHLKKTQFSFSSYSPGVLFMLGGVVIMGVTQVLAIPVRAVEIIPPGITTVCQDPETGNFKTCGVGAQTGLPDNDQGASLSGDEMPTSWTGTNPAQHADAGDVAAAGLGFATSEALETAYEPEPSDELLVSQLEALQLPDGYELKGLTASHLIVSGPENDLYTSVADLNFDLPDWGIVGTP